MTDDELAEIRGSLSAFAELVLGVEKGSLQTRIEILEAVEKAREGLREVTDVLRDQPRRSVRLGAAERLVDRRQNDDDDSSS